MQMTTIGMIGAGHIGRSFSLAAIANGYEILIANESGPDALRPLVDELGPNARAATAAQAASTAEFAIVAIPMHGMHALPVDELADKIVLTTCNYFAERDGPIPEIDSGTQTVPQYIQARLPASQVARAFNHLDAASIPNDGKPKGTPNRRALAYAADDPAAKRLAARLYDQFGFDAVDAGGLADAWRLDVDQPTFVVRQNAEQLRANLAKAERHTS
jgi:8-hydroxy-5-deazaflavin:NADPH oxidoreductase